MSVERLEAEFLQEVRRWQNETGGKKPWRRIGYGLGGGLYVRNLTIKGGVYKDYNSIDPVDCLDWDLRGDPWIFGRYCRLIGVAYVWREDGEGVLIGRRSNIGLVRATWPDETPTEAIARHLRNSVPAAENGFLADYNSPAPPDVMEDRKHWNDLRVGVLKIAHKVAELFPHLRTDGGRHEVTLLPRSREHRLDGAVWTQETYTTGAGRAYLGHGS